MRTDADQERRNARYPACGRADRQTAGPRSIACDDAPSDRWKSAHGGSSAAPMQPKHPVAERGRLHGASELNVRTRNRSAEHRLVYYRILKEERRWAQSITKHNRLRWRDKRPRGAGCGGRVISMGYPQFSRGAGFPCTSQDRRFSFFARSLPRCVAARLAVVGGRGRERRAWSEIVLEVAARL